MPAPHVSADGVLAQLGARNIRNVEATGSNPVYSIQKQIRTLHISARILSFLTEKTVQPQIVTARSYF